MDSAATILIIFVVVGIIILGAIWALSRNSESIEVPPAKLDDTSAPSASLQDVSAPAKEIAASLPEPKPAPKPTAKPGSTASAGPTAKKDTLPKAKPAKTPRLKQTALKKDATNDATPPPLTAIGVPAAVGSADNLLQIKGLGPKLNTLLDGLGITRFDQIAAWSAEDVAKVDEHLGAFKGRIERDSWIEQAGFLAKGAIAEFEAKFGKLDSENK